MKAQVARRYQFNGVHHVPNLPEPWCNRHTHVYTVEVVVEGLAPVVCDTDVLDRVWLQSGVAQARERLGTDDYVDLDELYSPEHTTVEALADDFFDLFWRGVREWVFGVTLITSEVVEVTVWEDQDRWGKAIR